MAVLPTAIAHADAASAADRPEHLLPALRAIAGEEIVLLSLRAQNARYADLTASDIAGLDAEWRAEQDAPAQPLIARLMSGPLSTYLIDAKARSLGLFVEIFVMDAQGLNVGQSSITSDYWQGDEAKWQQTFARGPQAVHVGEAGFDDAYRIRTRQVSFTLTDPATGHPVGAATFEINLTELERRS